MADKQSEDQEVAEFKASFAMFDRDGDGRISPDDLGSLMSSLGLKPTQDELRAVVSLIASDSLDFESFTKLMRFKFSDANETDQELMEVFRAFDTDGNGLLSAEELQAGFSKLGEQLPARQVRLAMQQAGAADEHGRIDYEGFRRMMNE